MYYRGMNELEAVKSKNQLCGGSDRHKLYQTFMLLQEKWVLFILLTLLEGPQGFNEIGRRANGVNTTTLSQRLNLLEQASLVTRTVQSTIPPRTSYELTEAGLAFQEVIECIARWSDQYLALAPNEAPACAPE